MHFTRTRTMKHHAARSLAERTAAARNRVQPTRVDFARIPPTQWDVHERLENWGRWSHGSDGRGRGVAPGFESYRTSDRWVERTYGELTVVTVNSKDAVAIQKTVNELPEKHRQALHWAYIHGGKNAQGQAWKLALSLQGLADMLSDARIMVRNRAPRRQ